MWNLLRLEPDNIPNTLVAESVNTLVPSEDITFWQKKLYADFSTDSESPEKVIMDPKKLYCITFPPKIAFSEIKRKKLYLPPTKKLKFNKTFFAEKV